MKTILYMAMSVNGYIARANGDEDFLSHKNWEAFSEIAKECGCFVIGRKTYEAVQGWGEKYSFDTIEARAKVVVTKNKDFKADEKYTVADSPADALAKLKALGFEKVLVTGGATINSAFMQAGLIDEIFLNVEPFVLGQGVPLFSEEEFAFKLNFLGTREIGDGIIQLRYQVEK